MAISSTQMYRDTKVFLNQYNSEYIPPEEFVSYYKSASDSLFNEYLGNKTHRRAVYGNNSITDHRLNGFRRESTPIPYTPSTGVIAYPEDCRHIRAVTDNFGDAIKYQDDDRFAGLRRDSNVNLQLEAYYKEEGDGIQVLTEKPISNIIISYLEAPGTPELPYTIVGREIVFDEPNVVDLDWSEGQAPVLINRILALAGVTLRDSFVVQTGNNGKNEE